MSKRVLLAVGVLLCVLFIAAYASYYKRYALYDMAMEYEYRKANWISKQVSVNGVSISYAEGPRRINQDTLVLIHGFGAIKENWLRFAQVLSEDFHIIALDLPGHGNSTRDLNLLYTIEEQSQYVQEFIRYLGLGRVHLIGNSMGGWITAYTAATSADQLLTASLINPGGIYIYDSELEAFLEKDENPLIVKSHQDLRRLMGFAMEKPPFIPWPINHVVAERAIDRNAINSKIFSDINGREQDTLRSLLPMITVPTFVMWGQKDRIINVKNMDYFMQLIPNVSGIIYDDIGHVPMIEIPELSAGEIRSFIMKNSD